MPNNHNRNATSVEPASVPGPGNPRKGFGDQESGLGDEARDAVIGDSGRENADDSEGDNKRAEEEREIEEDVQNNPLYQT